MGGGHSGPKYMDEIKIPSNEKFIDYKYNDDYIIKNIFLIEIIILFIITFFYYYKKKRYKD